MRNQRRQSSSIIMIFQVILSILHDDSTLYLTPTSFSVNVVLRQSHLLRNFLCHFSRVSAFAQIWRQNSDQFTVSNVGTNIAKCSGKRGVKVFCKFSFSERKFTSIWHQVWYQWWNFYNWYSSSIPIEWIEIHSLSNENVHTCNELECCVCITNFNQFSTARLFHRWWKSLPSLV